MYWQLWCSARSGCDTVSPVTAWSALQLPLLTSSSCFFAYYVLARVYRPRISVQFFMVDGVWRVNSGGEVFADITVRILSDSSWIYHKTDRLQFASWCYLLCQHNATLLCVEKHWIHVWFVSSVSSSDGDKKKKQKGKGTLEPSVGQPTKLATLKVLSSLTLHTRLMTVTFNDVRCSEWKSDQLWWTSENTTHTQFINALGSLAGNSVKTDCSWLTASSPSY